MAIKSTWISHQWCGEDLEPELIGLIRLLAHFYIGGEGSEVDGFHRPSGMGWRHKTHNLYFTVTGDIKVTVVFTRATTPYVSKHI